MYQIVASKAEYTEEEVREALAATHPNYEIESMKNDNGWLVRLKEKTAEFPFKDDEKKDDDSAADDAVDKADDASDEADDAKDDADDAEDKADDAKDDADDADGDIDPSDGIDEGEAKDLVGQLNELQGQLNKLVDELGGKAQEVAEDAKAKDDKIKEIADSVSEVAPPMDAAADLPGLRPRWAGSWWPSRNAGWPRSSRASSTGPWELSLRWHRDALHQLSVRDRVCPEAESTHSPRIRSKLYVTQA